MTTQLDLSATGAEDGGQPGGGDMKMLLINDKAGSVRTAAAEAQRFTQQGYAARPLPEWREFVEGRVDGRRKLRRQSTRKQQAA